MLAQRLDLARSAVDSARRSGATFADIRIIREEETHLVIQDGRADRLHAAQGLGAGLRVLVDGGWGFAATDQVSRQGLAAALDAALAAARANAAHGTEPGVIAKVEAVHDREEATCRTDPRQVPVAEKVRRLLWLEEAARKHCSARLANSLVTYSDLAAEEAILNSLGSCIERQVIRTSVNTHMTAADERGRQRGLEARGALAGYEVVEELEPEEFTLKAAKRAVELLSARPAPGGVFPVVFHPSITGLLTHEALGHNSEADSIWSGESILAGRLGEEVASPLVTMVDDPTLAGAYGSYLYDDEGTPAQRTVIIEGGRLRSYLHSLESAARLGHAPNGHGRADGSSYPAIVRMSNTFLAPGQSAFAELLRGIDRGIYLAQGHWGYVFVEKGLFTCHALVSRMIEHGELGELLRDVSVSGLTLETLQDIDAVGSDFEMLMPGMCGKAGQGAFIDAGGPHVRVRRLLVGGHGTG
jgi:TldD protein